MLRRNAEDIEGFLQDFCLEELSFGQKTLLCSKNTLIDQITLGEKSIRRYTNEFWTSRQRQAGRIHEISYRACFKPQLPAFFINLLTEPGDVVYDPFSGRGTTAIEAGMRGRKIISNDINPLSRIITEPRLHPPLLEDVRGRIFSIPELDDPDCDIDLSMFYHPKTLQSILSIRKYLLERISDQTFDHLDGWIRMVATNRLTGHSNGFFSVYTLPPNQAVSPERQVKINLQRKQTPPYRDVRELLLKKSRVLLKGLEQRQYEYLNEISKTALFLNTDAGFTPDINDNSVSLTVTSPPFLDIVQYGSDNWLRCWFNGLDAGEIGSRITMARRIEDWEEVMGRVFHELYRITIPGGWVAFEVGEVRKGSIRLDEHVVPLGLDSGFECLGIIINMQDFTKTANIWGVSNMNSGTNSNRIALFQKK